MKKHVAGLAALIFASSVGLTTPFAEQKALIRQQENLRDKIIVKIMRGQQEASTGLHMLAHKTMEDSLEIICSGGRHMDMALVNQVLMNYDETFFTALGQEIIKDREDNNRLEKSIQKINDYAAKRVWFVGRLPASKSFDQLTRLSEYQRTSYKNLVGVLQLKIEPNSDNETVLYKLQKTVRERLPNQSIQPMFPVLDIMASYPKGENWRIAYLSSVLCQYMAIDSVAEDALSKAKAQPNPKQSSREALRFLSDDMGFFIEAVEPTLAIVKDEYTAPLIQSLEHKLAQTKVRLYLYRGYLDSKDRQGATHPWQYFMDIG